MEIADRKSRPSAELLHEGFAHHSAGRLDAAEALYRNVLARDANNPDALHLLGMLLNQRGHHGQAVELIRRAVVHTPQVAEFHNSLGTVLGALGRTLEAETEFRQAVALKSDYAEAYRNLGLSLRKQQRLEEAAIAFRRATHLRPNYGEALANLAAVMRDLGEAHEAAEAEREALAIQGGPPEAFNTLGLDLRALRKLDEAIEQLRQAVRLAPNDPFLHFNLALVLLESGQLEEGFAEYEWRWRLPEFVKRTRDFGRPRWDGSELKGRTILLYTEQGLGTNIQFVRYATLVAQHGGKVILHCPPTLAKLFATVEGVSQVLAGGGIEKLPPFDVHAPLASLPHLLGTTLETIPNQVPYFKVDPQRVEAWRPRITGEAGELKVGLVWAGNQKPDPARTCPLAEFGPLARVEGVRFYSLQKGEFAAQMKQAPEGLRLIDLSDRLQDFSDTAAAVSLLDLVISVDTSVAHLTGALGKPVCTLLPYLADWRWLVDRTDTPWYPTMRLFRQPGQGQWTSVLEKISSAAAPILKELILDPN
jgi:Flp pilus assembly protein TadD